jgi:hypothetical protein
MEQQLLLQQQRKLKLTVVSIRFAVTDRTSTSILVVLASEKMSDHRSKSRSTTDCIYSIITLGSALMPTNVISTSFKRQ